MGFHLHDLCTRKCRSVKCQDVSFHTHHLTLIGKWRHIWRFPRVVRVTDE